MNNLYYIETSALNYLEENITDFDFFNALKRSGNVDFCISPTVIWEVLLNSSDASREKLIYWCQFNCANYLLKSPAELLIGYLELGCPKNDKKEFWYNRETKLDIGKNWASVHSDIEKTLLFDSDDLKERTSVVRDLSKKFKAIITSYNEKSDCSTDFIEDAVEAILNSQDLNGKNKKTLFSSVILTFFFVCMGVELDNSPVRKFWNNLKIIDPIDRLDWIIANYPKFFIRGPVAEMSAMVTAQFISSNSRSRGLVHDCWHSIYCYYADNFITGDQHFEILRNEHKEYAFEGIIMTHEFEKIFPFNANELNQMLDRHKRKT